jgi:hemerythrin
MNDDIVVWNDVYSVGVTQFDEQHKTLVTMINDLFQICKNETTESKVPLVKAFSKAAEYAQSHFHVEEEHLKQINYPGLQEQIKEHQAFMTEIWSQFNKFQNNELNFIDLPRFLKNWLLNHIAVIDKKYSNFA